jgi:hypothetical protein
MDTLELEGAEAFKAPDAVETSPSIQARFRDAFIHI